MLYTSTAETRLDQHLSYLIYYDQKQTKGVINEETTRNNSLVAFFVHYRTHVGRLR
ncbi:MULTISPECIES: hypothetical protein [unclassified Neochlamydia]|uniref:hypothetical protein n=1 Tax=unclassified Neochlamydia TaxID=2643326 RepID=UPI00138DE720|nr:MULTISPECIES: hypothetical protein [unclassified Neochlamydia]